MKKILNKKKECLGLDNIETLKSQISFARFIYNEEGEKGILKVSHLCSETLEKLKKFSVREPFVLVIKKLIALLLRDFKNFIGCLDILNDNFESEKELFGLYHLDTSNTMFEIAKTLFLMGEEEDSLIYFEETLKIQLIILEPNHEKTLSSRYWLANVLYSQQMYLEALDIYERDLKSRISILGAEHAEIFDTKEKIDFIYSQVIQKKRN